MICLPPQGTPPHTAAGTAHSTHSTPPALPSHRATPRVEDNTPVDIPLPQVRPLLLSHAVRSMVLLSTTMKWVYYKHGLTSIHTYIYTNIYIPCPPPRSGPSFASLARGSLDGSSLHHDEVGLLQARNDGLCARGVDGED